MNLLTVFLHKLNPRRAAAALLAVTLVFSPLCRGQRVLAAEPAPPGGPVDALVMIPEEVVPLAGTPGNKTLVRVPESPGTVTKGNNLVTIDASNTSEGYITVKYTGSNGKVKLQITKGSGTTYTYNLTKGKTDTFPLTAGNGSYTVNVYENVSGTSYALAYGASISVQLRDATLPFLYPSQYVNFNSQSKTVQKGIELASTAQSDLQIVENVYNYVISNISYDDYKAANVQSGYLPNVDTILASGKGICFDYTAVMAAMLRSQQIPTKLVVGYSGQVYHAWVNVYITDVGWVNGIIYFDGKSWKHMDPTFASSGNSSQTIMQYIENPANYSAMYIY